MTADEVLVSIRRDFPMDRWAQVSSVLETYGVEDHERERSRVQLAILKLCAGDERKLKECVQIAKKDYRDILFWADHPGQAKISPEERKKAIATLGKLGATPPEE